MRVETAISLTIKMINLTRENDMKEPALKPILSALSDMEAKVLSTESSTHQEELTPEQMITMLRRLFGNSVDIIDPALSLQASPLVGGPLQGVGAVLYLQALRQLAPPGARGRVLSQLAKPIVMLVAQPRQEEKSRTSGFSSSSQTHRPAVTVNVWKAIVIVPRNYAPPEGKPVGNNENPLAYYFDPQSNLPATQAPREVITFCQTLMQGCQVPTVHQGRPVRVTVEPVFGQLGFFHGCRAMCTETSDSPWWALYFAVMAVARGGVSFPETGRLTLSRLHAVLGSVLQEPEVTPVLPAASSSAMTSSSFAIDSASAASSSSSLVKEEKAPVVEEAQDRVSSSSPSSSSTVAEPVVSAPVVAALPDLNSLPQASLTSGVEIKPARSDSSGQTPPVPSVIPETKVSPANLSWLQEAVKVVATGFSRDSKKKSLSTIQDAGLFSAFHLEVYQTLPEMKLSTEDRRSSTEQGEYIVRDLSFLNKPAYWLQSTLKYWHQKQGNLQNRQVVYFFRVADGHGLGFVVRWLNPDTALAKQMWEEHRVTGKGPKMKQLLKKIALTEAVPNFYTEVQVMVFRGCEQVAVSGKEFDLTGVEAGCRFQSISPTALYALTVSPESVAQFGKLEKSHASMPVASTTPEEKKSLTSPVYEGPAYTPAILAGILRAYQIAPSPDAKLSRDSSGEFELTAYPGSNLTETVFLQDLLHYWRAQQGRLENRRVAYLFNATHSQTGQPQSLGVVIQYSAPNTAVASQLWQAEKEQKLESKSVQVASQFYAQVQVTVLGIPVQPTLVEQLKAPFAKIGRDQITLNFKAIPLNNAYSVLLMEDMLGMLQHGQTREVDPGTVAVAHRERCLQALLTRWAETEHRDTALQQELTAVLRTVMIMVTLQTQRRSEYRLSGEGVISPKIIKTRDEAMKRHLYAQRFPDQRALIEGLPLAVLASFLVTADAVENIKTLNQHRDQLWREIRLWEMDLEEKIRHHRTTPCDVLTQAWQFIYHSSFLGLGGELFRLGSAPLETASESAEDLAAQEALLVSRMVQRVTRSETLSARSETAVRLFLGTEPISRSLGVLGTLVGAAVQIALGPYAFVQMLGISALTLRMHHTVEAWRLDEPRAELRSSVLSLNVLHRLCVLLWHGGEALALGSVVPLVSATGGLVGSAVAVAITSPLSPPASRPELGGLLIRQTGAIVGQRSMMALLVMAIGVQHRILYRDTAVALLSHSASRQPGIREWKIESADFRNPRLWSNSQHNPLTLSWLTQSGATRRVKCEIQGLPVLTPAGITGLVCAGDVPDPELSTTLGLPKP